MALVTPPSYYQAGTYPAKNDRLLTQSLIGQNGTRGNAMKVAAQSTPAMSVSIASGGAFIPSSTNNGSYFVYNDAATTVSITTADATNPRKDIVYVLVSDAAISGATNAVTYVVLAGTPAATPVAPTLPALATQLAEVYVAAGATSITNANITDARPRSQVVDCAVTTTGQVASPTAGMLVWDSSTSRLNVYDGTTWQLVYPISLGGITGAQIATNTITSSNMATGSVTTAAILDGTILTADIADGQITSAKIADATIVTGDLADGAVTTAKIAGSAITPAQVSNNTYTMSITGNAGYAYSAGAASTATSATTASSATNAAQLASGSYSITQSGNWWYCNTEFDVAGLLFLYTVNGSSTNDVLVLTSAGEVKKRTLSPWSLREMKEDIAPITDALDKVASLTPRTFKFKEDVLNKDDDFDLFDRRTQTQYGFVIDEMLESDVPDVVLHYQKDDEGAMLPQSWKSHAVISLAVAAIQELSAKVDALESRVAELEAK